LSSLIERVQKRLMSDVTATVPHRREVILATALRLFSERGVQAVSTRQIAAAVGISQPSLYAHFPNKHALVSEVCVRAFQTLAAHMQSISVERHDMGRLRATAQAYIDFALTQPDAYRIAFMIDEPLDDVSEGKPGAALGAGLTCFMIHRTVVAEELGEGLSEDEISILAQSLWAGLHGLVSLMIARPEFPWAPREALISRHLDILIDAGRRFSRP